MMPRQVAVDITVPFYDVDSMDIVWHGHYIKYFEDARCRLLDAAEYNYSDMRASGYGFPMIDIRIKYVRPARFNSRVQVIATLEEFEVRLRIAYRIIDIESGQVLTRGHSVQVAVDMASGEMCFAMPDIAREKLSRFAQG